MSRKKLRYCVVANYKVLLLKFDDYLVAHTQVRIIFILWIKDKTLPAIKNVNDNRIR